MMLTATTIIVKIRLSPDLVEKIIFQKWNILHVLFDCNALALASHTVTDLQVVQKIGRYTTIYVNARLVKFLKFE